jgi:hypothetical protein
MSATFCSWEVLPSDSRLPVVASGMTTDAGKARKDVEDAMSTRAHAGLGQLVRLVMPGQRLDVDDREWPLLGEIWQCRRARPGGYHWQPLHPSLAEAPEPSGEPVPADRPARATLKSPPPRRPSTLAAASRCPARTPLRAGHRPPISSRPR